MCEAVVCGKAFTCVSKLRKIYKNPAMCEDRFKEMFKEFEIGSRLNHSGLLKMLYFARRCSPEGEQELHLLCELMGGGNAQLYLDSLPGKRLSDINVLRDLTR